MYLVELRSVSLQGNSLGFVLSQISSAVITAIGYAWKYLRNLLAVKTSARTIFSIRDRTNSSVACSAYGVQWKSLFLMHFFNVLNSGKDFSVDLERNLFRLANFPLRLWTSLIVREDGSHNIAYVLSGHGGYPSWILSRCSATDHGTPVMSDSCHANISKFSLRSEHSFVRPFADSVPLIATS
ncbi:hypothetical protein Tco_1033260 [Tanacetum coccineum]|uniref:Uncharacterized protein n=1 Tax=Tanacetum coccineum TaxID=301880 RepID=A0ABQ5GED9_9ASTR